MQPTLIGLPFYIAISRSLQGLKMADSIVQLLLEGMVALYVCYVYAWCLRSAVLSCITLQINASVSLVLPTERLLSCV